MQVLTGDIRGKGPVQPMNYEKPQQWQNFGDANPKRHGGLFVKWTGNMWKFVSTTHPEDLPEELGQYHFEIGWFEELDVFEEGEPENGFSEDMENALDGYSNKPFQVVPENELPEGETMKDQMSHIFDEHGEWLIGSFAFWFSGYYGGDESETSSKYWEYLEGHGIDREEF